MNILIYDKNRNTINTRLGVNISALDFVIEIDGSIFKYIKDRRSGRNDTYSLSSLSDHLSQIQAYYARQRFISDVVDLMGENSEEKWKIVNSLVTEYERSKGE